jgi:integrase
LRFGELAGLEWKCVDLEKGVLEEAGEKVSTVLREASGSILVAAPKQAEVRSAKMIEISSAPGEIARGLRRLAHSPACRTPGRLRRRRVEAA